MFPHARAMAALVQAYATEDLDQALDLYIQLQQDSVGIAAVTLSNRYMWQCLIEAACWKKRLDVALKVCPWVSTKFLRILKVMLTCTCLLGDELLGEVISESSESVLEQGSIMIGRIAGIH